MSHHPQKTSDLHHMAMDLSNEAQSLENIGDLKNSSAKFMEAFELEKEAAMRLMNCFNVEPSRSMLFHHAANLALKADLNREAERMAAFGLSGNPSTDMANYFRDILRMQHVQQVAGAMSGKGSDNGMRAERVEQMTALA